MRVRRLVLGQLDTNCWLADDEAGGPLAVIDPAGDAEELLHAIAGEEVGVVVLTHGHFDHLGAADAVREQTGAPLAVHRADAPWITTGAGTGGEMFGMPYRTAVADCLLEDGDVVEAGRLRLRVLHTPGHTPGSICLFEEAQGHLFSGDTLFAGSVGRSDFPGGDGRALARALAEKLVALPEDTVVHPGHGPDTTIAREARVNPFWPRA